MFLFMPSAGPKERTETIYIKPITSILIFMAKLTEKIPRNTAVYSYVQGLVQGISTGESLNRLEIGIRSYPKHFACWRDLQTNHTVLMSLSHYGHDRLAGMLLEAVGGLDKGLKRDMLNEKDNKGRTAMDWAETPSMRVLLKAHGARYSLNRREEREVDPADVLYIARMSTGARQHLRTYPETPRR